MARMDMTIRNPEREAYLDAQLKADGLPPLSAWLDVTEEVRIRYFYSGVLGTYASDDGPQNPEDRVVGSQMVVRWHGDLIGSRPELGLVWERYESDGTQRWTRVDKTILRAAVFDTPS